MDRMILVLKFPPGAEARLERRLDTLQDPTSPDFHRWLTPEQFGAGFGAAAEDLDRVTGWLREEGFRVDGVARGRLAVTFSGTVGQVQRAFQTPIRRYRVDGQVRQANAADPAIPRALAGLVEGVASLHNLPHPAMNTGLRPAGAALARDHALTPGDFATIYNLRSLYQQGIDGSGVTIAVVGRTHFPMDDVAAFRREYGLPARDPEILLDGRDPGDQGYAEDGEAHLDVEWSGAVAPGATIRFVASASTAASDGVDLSAQCIVDRDLAPIVTASFGQCEDSLGAAERAFFRHLWAQAAAQGMTVLVASGDSGCAACSPASNPSATGRAVNGLASTPYNLAVGGTQFQEGSGTYWRGAPDPDGSSVITYIPEAAWNESGAVPGGQGLWATGGGASCFAPKPCWQNAPGVPRDQRYRYLPDLALAAAGGHDPYLIRSGGQTWRVGGTSCAAPAFAGIMALVVQRTSERQGNPGPVLYRLFGAQSRGAGPEVFHDVAGGDNDVPGARGFPCIPGYDLATGLGSPDTGALVNAWVGGYGSNVHAVILAPAGNLTVASGTEVAFQGEGRTSATDVGLACAWTFGDGARAQGAASRHRFQNPGPAPVTRVVAFTATDGTGISETDTRTVRVLPAPAPGERIVNGGFEQGSLGWTARNVHLGEHGRLAPAHLGDGNALFSGWLAGFPQVLQQTVTLPAQARAARLSFWLRVMPHGFADRALDTFQVKVRGVDGRLATVATWSNLDAAPDYRQHPLDLGAYLGQRIQLAFVATVAGNGPSTSFALDDVSLVAR
jgi:hypothetical protein